jgi:hypothetical protein
LDPAIPVELDELVYVERPVGRVILSGTPRGFVKALAMQPQLEYGSQSNIWMFIILGHEYTQILILAHPHFVKSEELLGTVIKT